MNVHVQEHVKILRHFYSISNEIMLTLYSMYVGRIMYDSSSKCLIRYLCKICCQPRFVLYPVLS